MTWKNKNAQTLKDAFENILISSKTSPKLIETDRGKQISTDFLDKNEF